MNFRLTALLLLLSTPAFAQDKLLQPQNKPLQQQVQISQPLDNAAQQQLQQHLQKIDAYYQAVDNKLTHTTPILQDENEPRASAASFDGEERDPFQVTPELRSKLQKKPAPTISKFSGTPAARVELPRLTIKALMMGASRFAVIEVEQEGQKAQEMVIREGETLNFGNAEPVRVARISGDGLLLQQIGSTANDMVMVK